MPDYDEIPLPSDAADAVEDGRVYNMTDYSFYYKLKDCDTYFTFSPEGKLVGISSRDAAVVFTKVVRIGSSLDDAIAVYGREYVENPEDYSAVQYNMFRFFPQDLSLKSWITSNSPKQHFQP